MEVAAPARTGRESDYFFLKMSAVCGVVALCAFAPTYCLQLPAGTFVGSPLLAIQRDKWSLFCALPSPARPRGRSSLVAWRTLRAKRLR